MRRKREARGGVLFRHRDLILNFHIERPRFQREQMMRTLSIRAGLHELERRFGIRCLCEHGGIEQQWELLPFLRLPVNLCSRECELLVHAHLLRHGLGDGRILRWFLRGNRLGK